MEADALIGGARKVKVGAENWKSAEELCRHVRLGVPVVTITRRRSDAEPSLLSTVSTGQTATNTTVTRQRIMQLKQRHHPPKIWPNPSLRGENEPLLHHFYREQKPFYEPTQTVRSICLFLYFECTDLNIWADIKSWYYYCCCYFITLLKRKKKKKTIILCYQDGSKYLLLISAQLYLSDRYQYVKK